jgi:hypothetical protein
MGLAVASTVALLFYGINYRCKKYYNAGPRVDTDKKSIFEMKRQSSQIKRFLNIFGICGIFTHYSSAIGKKCRLHLPK